MKTEVQLSAPADNIGIESCAVRHHMLQDYESLFAVEFCDIDGVVLAVQPDKAVDASAHEHRTPEDRARYENMENHRHFDFPVGDSIWERWRNNRTLSFCVQRHWEQKLRNTFPDRAFVMFIVNELVMQERRIKGFELIDIMPTLRLWSSANDTSNKMFEGFRVADADPDLIMLQQGYVLEFVPEDGVFTKQHLVRKSFAQRLQRADAIWDGG